MLSLSEVEDSSILSRLLNYKLINDNANLVSLS
jgi:hypothetical protein